MLGCKNPGARKNSDSLAEFVSSLWKMCMYTYIYIYFIFICVYLYIHTLFLERYASFRFEETYLACIMLIGCRWWLWPTAFSCLRGRTWGNLKLLAKWSEWWWPLQEVWQKDVKMFFSGRKMYVKNANDIYIIYILYICLHAQYGC